MDATSVLTRPEICQCVEYIDYRALTSKNFVLNRVVFRLSCCVGLRRKEIAGLIMDDVIVEGPKPVIKVRKENTKGKYGKYRSRVVPLWWDKGTFRIIEDWHHRRMKQGAGPSDPFLCQQRKDKMGKKLTEENVSDRWDSCLQCLPEQRQKQLSIHKGRHTFASFAIAAGRSLPEVQHALGHQNIHTTSVYLHLIEREGVPDVFGEF